MYNIAVLPGDGIGPEIVEEAIKVLKAVGKRFGYEFNFTEALVGGAAYDAVGHPLPQETLDLCFNSDAVLLGAVGGDKWDNLPSHLRPEVGALLPLRKKLGLFANLRPAVIFPALVNASTLKPEVVEGLDIMVVRELTGGLYFGEKKKEEIPGGYRVVDTLVYTTEEIVRVARLAFDLAGKRRKKVTLVDKANVLESSRYWREVVTELAGEYPDIELDCLYVDNAAMQLVKNPKQFDVLLTENMFGDILSDQASQLTGSLGMLASASLGGKIGLYEPSHGSAPKYAGLKRANPIATIMSGAMLLRYSLNLENGARAIEEAITEVLNKYRTKDIMEEGKQLVSTDEMGDRIAGQILAG
ncbi:3-isopropylmalate dehydrogenase [Desulfolucanica intricata]|uniref:3-isopropylmalate dehydrogenase n=1 Tax=Desulfolucanica intricata TaxID=1285191 RepID=UPI0008336884|nr:3-isopropylmalate dehydrogenase [Desulfolucanica intricata]